MEIFEDSKGFATVFFLLSLTFVFPVAPPHTHRHTHKHTEFFPLPHKLSICFVLIRKFWFLWMKFARFSGYAASFNLPFAIFVASLLFHWTRFPENRTCGYWSLCVCMYAYTQLERECYEYVWIGNWTSVHMSRECEGCWDATVFYTAKKRYTKGKIDTSSSIYQHLAILMMMIFPWCAWWLTLDRFFVLTFLCTFHFISSNCRVAAAKKVDGCL